MYHLRIIERTGEVQNFELGDYYKKVDITKITKNSFYAQMLLEQSELEEVIPFIGKDSIFIVSPNYPNIWLSADEQNYIIDSTGNTIEKITPIMLEVEQWTKLLDKWNKE